MPSGRKVAAEISDGERAWAPIVASQRPCWAAF